MTNRYESPLSSRYASEYMLGLFSSDTRYQTWRRLWVALAKAEMSLRLPITQAQVANGLSDDEDMSEVREQSYRYYQKALCDGTHIAYLVFEKNRFAGAGGVS